MAKNNNLFFLSGLISLSLFAVFLSGFIYLLFSSKKSNIFALKKANYISISLKSVDIPKIKPYKKTTSTTMPDTTQNMKNIDVGDLFSDVWTKKIDIKKSKQKSTDAKRLAKIQKRVKKLKNNDVKSASDILKKAELVSSKKSTQSTSASNEVNEYLAKIQALVYQHFFPPQNSQGYSVKAVIKLSAIGKVLDFRILNYSSNNALNEECDKIRERLMGVLFPVNPKNSSGNYIIILKAKE